MSELTEALATLEASPVSVVESADDVSPERLELMRQAFALHLAGETYEQIAERLDVSRASVGRLLAEYRSAYRKRLETEPTLHLIAERLSRYEAIAATALRDAESATSDRGRHSHRQTALRAMRQFDELALSVGVLPKEPEKIYSATINMKPSDLRSDGETDPRSAEDIAADIQRLLKHTRVL